MQPRWRERQLHREAHRRNPRSVCSATPSHRCETDPVILNSYAGEYRLEDRFTIKVSVAGDRLETIWLGEKTMLLPESEMDIFQEDSDRTFRFVKDASGKVTSLIISVTEELVLRRVK